MAFMRAGTQHSMVSRAWSTSDFFDGVADVMAKGSDSIPDLPDDIGQLEDNMGLLLAQYLVSIECFRFFLDNGYRNSCLKTVLLICMSTKLFPIFILDAGAGEAIAKYGTGSLGIKPDMGSVAGGTYFTYIHETCILACMHVPL